VVALHGLGRTGAWMQRFSGLSAAADHAGFIVAYPTARTAAAGWPLVRRDAHDEADDIRDFIDLAGRDLCADPTRVFVTGVSNGAGMTARLGCELADRLTAVAPVAGGYGSLSGPCRPSRPLSVLEIHGSADSVVPYYGKPPDFAGSVLRWLGEWRSLDRCPGRAVRSQTARYRAQKLVWRGCAGETVVEHYRLAGVGHTWPGSPQDRQSAFPAAAVVLGFFASRPRVQLR
jgi:polyhydroxybutyrate depolymerase